MDRQECESLLMRHGVKSTPNRVIVAEALSEAREPVSLSELEEKIVSIDKSGIFRTLALFRGHHLVHVIDDGSGSARYELCHSEDEHDDDDQHLHFYCEVCRRTFCLSEVPVPEISVPQGYEITSTNFVLHGICPECSRK